MADAELRVRDGFCLSPIRSPDKPALLEYLNTRDIYETTLNIPFPYLEGHADLWLKRRAEQSQRISKEVCFAILNSTGKLIGAVSADSFEPGATHQAEIGYWLARPFWGHGIMTDAVRAYVDYAFRELGVVRLMAHTLVFNRASQRVLEKNGFQLEGRFRKHLMKEGKLIDAHFYGLLKEDLQR